MWGLLLFDITINICSSQGFGMCHVMYCLQGKQSFRESLYLQVTNIDISITIREGQTTNKGTKQKRGKPEESPNGYNYYTRVALYREQKQ